jgi:hypothetical protein
MKRWDFLKVNIPKYLVNSLIDEIVIVDETGEDYDLLKEAYGSETKIKLYKNTVRLGVFFNKIESISKATNDWVCLIDSDNFADEDYFIGFFSFINNNPVSNVIYCPSFAKPKFDFGIFQGQTICKNNVKTFLHPKYNGLLDVILNLCNFIVHRSASQTIRNLINTDTDLEQISRIINIKDSIFINYLLLKEGFEITIVPNMEYEHVFHAGCNSNFIDDTYKDVENQIFDKICNM